MTSHERFEMTLNKQVPDRLPMDLLWPRAETLRALKEHFKTDEKEEVLQKLGVDFRWISMPMRHPEFKKKVNGKLEGDAPGAGNEYIFHDRQTFEDAWGIVHRVGDDGKYLEWKGGPLVGKENLDGWLVPETVFPSVDEVKNLLKPYKDYIIVTEVSFPFKIAWHICGYEHFMTLMALNQEMVEQLYDAIYGFSEKRACLAAEAGYDVVALVGDVAGQNGMMFSPAMFEKFDVPRFKHLVEKVKEANPKTRVFYHSDGDMEEIIPHLIECGIDILNPIQSACMDPAKIKEKYGEKLTLHGTISVQDTIPNGTVNDVRNEVNTRIKTVGYNGGLVVSPENSFPFDAPLENILEVYNAVKEFDYKSLEEIAVV